MKIRNFKDNDAGVICKIIKENNREIASEFYPKKVIEYWNNKLITSEHISRKVNNRRKLVLENKGRVIGYVCFDKNILKMLFIDKRFHNKGFGTKLVLLAEKIIFRNNYSKIIAKPNINYENFFKSLWYKKKKIVYKKTGKIK